MTSNIEKFLAKITAKEKDTLDVVAKKVKNKDFTGLDVKKLLGMKICSVYERVSSELSFKLQKIM